MSIYENFLRLTVITDLTKWNHIMPNKEYMEVAEPGVKIYCPLENIMRFLSNVPITIP